MSAWMAPVWTSFWIHGETKSAGLARTEMRVRSPSNSRKVASVVLSAPMDPFSGTANVG